MFADARELDQDELEVDVCIVGAGAAGISLAREWSGKAQRVCLLESGGLESNEQTQLLADGDSVGTWYGPLVASRLRYFGGTTNHWGGYCRPQSAMDLEARAEIPRSGWPISRDELDPWYARALGVLGLRSPSFEVSDWEPRSRHAVLPLESERLENTLVQVVTPKSQRRFGRIYRDELEQARNVSVLLHANALEFEANQAESHVERVRAGTLSGKRFSVRARQYVLAVGGLENPRLLLLSNGRNPAGLGNARGLVGRFFMEHPRFVGGLLQPSLERISVDFYRTHRVGDSAVKGYLALRERVKRAEGLLDVQLRFSPVFAPEWNDAMSSAGARSTERLAHDLSDGKLPDGLGEHLSNVLGDLDDLARIGWLWARNGGAPPVRHIEIIPRIEQLPNPESRVSLGARLDELGQRRLRLDWRLHELDLRSARRAVEIFGEEAGKSGLGRVRVLLADDDSRTPPDARGGWHHMGTTRMSDDPAQGVVDRDCRVHGIDNLYVAGSSVFPTAGSGTPTLTLVALALRLADHLKERMQ